MSVIDPLEVQFGLVHDCIRACVFADYIGRTKPKPAAWLSICDLCYSDAIMSWNALFGTNSQESHWKKLIQTVPVPERSKLKRFGLTMILDYLKTTEDKWRIYHQELVAFRNDRLAHFNHGISYGEPPNFTWALHSAYLYREWLIQLLRAQQTAGIKIEVTKTTGQDMLALFKEQISEICK